MGKATAKGAAGRPKAKAKATITKAKAVPQSLLEKGRVDRTVVKGATTMTKEQWDKHQEGMDELWPLPEYMNGQKGSTKFKDETFSIVTCWTASTRIQYRPHAKRPGSKSHLRYESYSRAKTVGEAFALCTYPMDWCWDYERGFIRVVGGHVREEPLDSNQVKEGGKEITAVDVAIHTWYKRELAKKLGITVAELSEHTAGESLAMRGQRLLAQQEAKARLEAAEKEGRCITDEEVLETLKRWAFFKNPWRQNVMKEGEEWVYSDTLGLLRDRQGDIHLTAPTRRYPQVSEILARWLTDRLPEGARGFTFTSMNVNCNYAAQLHRDQGNFGPSFIKAFGEFSGGQLNYWPEDNGGKLDSLPRAKKIQMDLKESLALFNGNCAHSVEAFAGTRYSVVYFTLGCHVEALESDKAKLRQMGVPYPSADEDPHALLRAPRGYKGSDGARATPARPGKQELPAWQCWSTRSLKGGSSAELKKAGAAAAKRRLAPEGGRSFYTAEKRRQRKEEEAAAKS